ncbi:hypothetical protein O1M54_35250 [Streptomyces diastatochromogenes]|nr:hypothetical protein [Streptomyces diastatochromogenes]
MREEPGRAAAGRGAALRDVIDTGDASAWLWLDEGVRTDEWYFVPYTVPSWEETPGGRSLTAALHADGPLTEGQLALALCHRDGRIRYRALGRVTGRPALLPLVVVRCADWAQPVRERARKRLAEALDAETAARLAPLVRRLADRHRGDHALGLLGEVLRKAPGERLAPLLTSPDRPVRRFAYGLAVEEGLLSAVELARAAAGDDDAVVQTLCSEAALAAVAEEDAEEVLGRCSAPAVPGPVRRGDRAAAPGAADRAIGFLADRSALVRACARYVVRQYGTDPLPWYRDRCADPGDPALPPGAAIGLAECGTRADAGLLWPLLDHPAPGVRAKAVAGLRSLDVTDVPRMLRLLDDPAPGVVGEATLRCSLRRAAARGMAGGAAGGRAAAVGTGVGVPAAGRARRCRTAAGGRGAARRRGRAAADAGRADRAVGRSVGTGRRGRGAARPGPFPPGPRRPGSGPGFIGSLCCP